MRGLFRFTPFRQVARAFLSVRSRVTSGREVYLFPARSASNPGQKSTGLSAESATPERATPTGAEAAIYPRFGYQLLLDRSSLVDRVVIESGSWEQKQLDFLLRLAKQLNDEGNAVFLDIGAYWGLYSLLMAQSGLFQRIYAFEADAHNFAQLQANLFLNKATHRIEAFYKAVTNKNQTMYAWDSLSHPDGNRGGVGMVGQHDSRPSTQIEGVTIDSFLNLQDANLVVKIDVEGHEQHVLIGMEETLRRNRVIMQVEIYEQQMAATFPILERLGMRCLQHIEHDYYYTNIDPMLLGFESGKRDEKV